MTPVSSTFARNQPFEDKILDNKGFLEAMEEGLPSVLSGVEIHKQARLELQILLRDMKKQTFIQ